MAHLYMMHGYIGSGKTTFAHKLVKEENAILFSVDAWMRDLYGKNPPSDQYQSNETRIKKRMRVMAAQLLARDINIIFDFGYWSKSERDADRQFAKENQATAILYKCEAPIDVMKSRAIKRTDQDTEGQVFIDANAFDMLQKYFEPLSEDEAHLSVDTA